MPSRTRTFATIAVALGAAAAPALAAAATPSTAAVNARTRLTETIAKETPLVKLRYGVGQVLGSNAVQTSYAANIVGRIHADSAQLPAKLEWVLGAELQRRADNTIAYGDHEQVYHHPARGRRAVAAGFADLRLSNYFFANADSLLGVAHPRYMAAPYQLYKNLPVKISTPLIAKAPAPTLAAVISMGAPLLRQTIPTRILGTYVELNQDAAAYYSVLVGRMHAGHAQESAQRQWVDGVRTLEQGDEQLSNGIQSVRIIPPQAAATRAIQSGLATFRHADAQIGHADALLGVHQSGPTVALPAKVIYKS